MAKFEVFLSYVKECIVEANSEEEAIEKAHKGDVLRQDIIDACPENDEAHYIPE